MSCKYGMDTCAFRDTPEVCADCEDADSYEWDERIPTPQDDEEENRILDLEISTDGGETWETKEFITSLNSHKMNTEHSETDQLQDTEPNTGLITEDQAAELLQISRRSLKNMVYNGKMPKDAYTTAVTGKRFYFRDKLLGLPTE